MNSNSALFNEVKYDITVRLCMSTITANLNTNHANYVEFIGQIYFIRPI